MTKDLWDSFMLSTVHPHFSLLHNVPNVVVQQELTPACILLAKWPCSTAVLLTMLQEQRKCEWKSLLQVLWLLLFSVSSSLTNLQCEWSWILLCFSGSQDRCDHRTNVNWRRAQVPQSFSSLYPVLWASLTDNNTFYVCAIITCVSVLCFGCLCTNPLREL